MEISLRKHHGNMRCILLAIGLWLGGLCSLTNAQTYIDGYKVIPLSDVANSLLLKQNQRLNHTGAFEKLKLVDEAPFQKEVSDMVGEYWWIDDMLVRIATRQISGEFPQENLKDLQRAMTPSVPGVIGTVTVKSSMELYNDWFSEIKSVNNFEVLIHYFKTKSDTKYFFLQDKAGLYYVSGTIYVKKEDAPKAHQLIDTILNVLTFKE